ncbi:MAG: putative ATP-dependent endonuclease of OLD family [Psychroserpens sp.]|jgi:putative ATP-dependent endonuclease of OLD family
MAKIHSLRISNYRGIEKLEQVFGITDFICLIGRGDSGKTTILDAISKVLSPMWNQTFHDTDFYNGNISNPIEIEASLYDLPISLTNENKYGLYIRGLEKETNIIYDDIKDDYLEILTIKLIVDKNLEPKWTIVNNRENQEEIEMRANDRAKLNVFLVSDYVDKHFSWSKGNPLYSLLKQDDSINEKNNIILEAFREAKQEIDTSSFNHLDDTVKKVVDSASKLGADIKDSTTRTTIDFKDISINNQRISLHDDKIPFRLKGKGSKRIISMAIQTELSKLGGILLIDEIEQGLEPDRAQHLAQTLKRENKGQIFITTHSRDVLVELTTTDLFRVKNNYSKLYEFDSSLQGCIRSNPEAFFSNKVLVCEGPTEIGFCRGLNNYLITEKGINSAIKGVRFANGGGSTQIDYTKAFLNAGYKVCLFCDSDVQKINDEKSSLSTLGVTIIDSDDKKAMENHIFEDLPWDAIKELIEYRIDEKDEDSVKASINSKHTSELGENWKDIDSKDLRDAIYKSSIVKKKEWFKRTDHGEFIGNISLKYKQKFLDKKLGKQIDQLINWIEND